MPAAASGPTIEKLRSTCSRERWDRRAKPCWPSASRSSIIPANVSSGSWPKTCSMPWSAPMSVALRLHSPVGSGSCGMLGTTVSHTACSTARLDSLNSLHRPRHRPLLSCSGVPSPRPGPRTASARRRSPPSGRSASTSRAGSRRDSTSKPSSSLTSSKSITSRSFARMSQNEAFSIISIPSCSPSTARDGVALLALRHHDPDVVVGLLAHFAPPARRGQIGHAALLAQLVEVDASVGARVLERDAGGQIFEHGPQRLRRLLGRRQPVGQPLGQHVAVRRPVLGVLQHELHQLDRPAVDPLPLELGDVVHAPA